MAEKPAQLFAQPVMPTSASVVGMRAQQESSRELWRALRRSDAQLQDAHYHFSWQDWTAAHTPAVERAISARSYWWCADLGSDALVDVFVLLL